MVEYQPYGDRSGYPGDPSGSTVVYALLFPQDAGPDAPVALLNRQYSCIGWMPAADAVSFIRAAGGAVSEWDGWLWPEGSRPAGYEHAAEPVAYWLDVDSRKRKRRVPRLKSMGAGTGQRLA